MTNSCNHERSSADSDSISSTLLARVRARRPEAWERLVDLYGRSVYRWCRRGGLAPSDAADVVQDVFASVAANIDTFRRRNGKDSFTAWLATIAPTRRERLGPPAIGG